MNTTVSLAVAVPAAMVGAACMGLASAAQASATHQVRSSRTLSPRLLVDLARRPQWLLGVGATIAGLGLQVVALGFGPLILVQPLLVTALPFASFFAAVLVGRRLDLKIVLGAFTCVAGLSAFLLLARPTGGVDQLIHQAPLGELALGLGVIAACGLFLSSLVNGTAKVLGLALATGIFYGVTAGLMKVLAGQLRSGIAVPFQHWTLYVVCVVGPIGFLLSQNTFQQGMGVSSALAVITTVDPLVGVAIGVWWLGETAASGMLVVVGEVIAALVIVAGIAMLSKRNEFLVAPQHPHPVAEPAPHPGMRVAQAR
jgi:drug/metabolite transporter (DMT)-like permease